MKKEFEYQEDDKVGMKTLDVISEAVKFNKWMYDTIKPYCQGMILEVGSGVGNISKFFLEDGSTITLSDIRANYCNSLRENFGSFKNLSGVIALDLVHPDFDLIYSKYFENFDSLFALNVVEHIEDDSRALSNCKKLLKTGGNLVILVPAYQFLYNRFDEELYHYRRYTKKNLTTLFRNRGYNIIHSQYFNMMGMPGWYISGKLQKNKSIPKNQMKLYNSLVPVFKVVDKIFMNSMGLSVIVVGEK